MDWNFISYIIWVIFSVVINISGYKVYSLRIRLHDRIIYSWSSIIILMIVCIFIYQYGAICHLPPVHWISKKALTLLIMITALICVFQIVIFFLALEILSEFKEIRKIMLNDSLSKYYRMIFLLKILLFADKPAPLPRLNNNDKLIIEWHKKQSVYIILFGSLKNFALFYGSLYFLLSIYIK